MINETSAAALLRRGLSLEYATLAWNVVGVVVLAVAATRARSVALAGFGLDSLIEILASAIVVWQLKGDERRQRPALRLIAVAFVLLAAYIAVQAGFSLSSGAHPSPSALGVLWLVLTVAAMFALATGKRATGRRLGNPVLVSEAGVTMVDAYLAAAVLVGVTLNTLLGWWWADPVSSLIIVFYGVKEAREAWTRART